MTHVLKPPSDLTGVDSKRTVFLAGSIDRGSSVDWQSQLEAEWQDLDVTILNPRRDAWDESWEESASNEVFRGQVEWELEALSLSETIALYFAPDTKAPISLLELGLFASSEKVIVCCPEGYWKKGNVDIVCAKWKIPQVNSLDLLVERVRKKYS